METLLQAKRVWLQEAMEAAQAKCRLSNDAFHVEQRAENASERGIATSNEM
jgi:hypothetical protein